MVCFRCWRKPRTETPEPEEAEPDHVKPLMQVKALRTKCAQRAVALRRAREALRRCGDKAEARKAVRRPESADASAGAISRTADVWKVEVLRLKAAVQQRQCLNAGLRQEVEGLEKAFQSLIELGDQHVADLSCVQERNAALETPPSESKTSPECAGYEEAMPLEDMEQELNGLEAQLLQARREAAKAEAAAPMEAQLLQARGEAAKAEAAAPMEAQLLQARREASKAEAAAPMEAQLLQARREAAKAEAAAPMEAHPSRECEPCDQLKASSPSKVESVEHLDEPEAESAVGRQESLLTSPGFGELSSIHERCDSRRWDWEPEPTQPELPELPQEPVTAAGLRGAASLDAMGAMPPVFVASMEFTGCSGAEFPAQSLREAADPRPVATGPPAACAERLREEQLSQRLLREQIAQHRLKVELHRLRNLQRSTRSRRARSAEPIRSVTFMPAPEFVA
ncbi:unnamed protein product [Effrenium voratum]|uniref:Uncharacterized protein n=1 Tax=Effrenium voratum TaxID=2562239 RepID=A0AA36HV29_9DINO|nr:unnamed protein product [Effrenium voratum]